MVLGTAEALHTLAVGTAAPVDIFGNGGRADKADGGDGRVVQNRIDRFLVAVHHLQHAVRQAGFLHQFCQHQRHRRIAFAGLQDEGVATGKRRAHLPHRDHGGEVERGDPGGHAQRLAHGIHVNAWAGAVGEFAFQHLRRADAVFDHFQTALDVALGIGNGLAMLAAQRLGQLVHVAVQQADEFHHHPRAALRVGGAPFDLGLGGFGHGMVQLVLRSQRHAGLHLARGGVEHIGKAPRGALHMRAVDPVGKFLHSILPENVSLQDRLAEMRGKEARFQKRFAILQG